MPIVISYLPRRMVIHGNAYLRFSTQLKTLIRKYHVFNILYLLILTGTTLPANKHNINFEEIQLLHRCERWDYQGTTTFGTLGLRYSAREQTSISEHISFPPVYNIILNS